MVLSPRSVQTFDDAVETDTDCGFGFASGGFGSQRNLLDDAHSSTDAANNLHNALQQICALPQSNKKQLMLEVCGKG